MMIKVIQISDDIAAMFYEEDNYICIGSGHNPGVVITMSGHELFQLVTAFKEWQTECWSPVKQDGE